MKKMFIGALLASFAVGANAAGDEVVTATYGNATGNTTRTMTVALNHEKDYVAFMLQLTLPEGTTVKDVKAKAPLLSSETFDLSAKGGSATESKSFKVPFRQNGTKCNIVGYNYNNDKIAGASGDIILTVALETANGINFDANTVTTACTFVDASATEVELGSPVTEARLWGDVVKDGTVDGKDIQAVANIFSGKTNSGTIDKFAGDITGEGDFDGKDIQAIANVFSGKNK